MATQVTNYQCPACTAPLHFNAATGKLECEYCGSVYDTAQIESQFHEKEEKAEKAFADHWMKDGIGAYSCPSCGAELICDETTAATSCPYCGNPTIVPGKLGGMLEPDYIIPFKKTKEEAIQALKQHYKGKFLLPKSFKEENHIQEMKGVYVPFWLFDREIHGEITYTGTRSHSRISGEYRVTTTNHYHLQRGGTLGFERVPVDASKKMPDGHMDSIEPYKYEDMVPFSTAYLPGFFADKYDVSENECGARADRRCEDTFMNEMRDTVSGYETVVMKDKNIHISCGKVQYALMPVWMLYTKWKGKDYLFAMNGQTGRLVGDLPVSWARFWGLFAGIALPMAGVLALALMR